MRKIDEMAVYFGKKALKTGERIRKKYQNRLENLNKVG